MLVIRFQGGQTGFPCLFKKKVCRRNQTTMVMMSNMISLTYAHPRLHINSHSAHFDEQQYELHM